MGTKPAKHSRIELLTSGIHGTAMASKRYFPENDFSRAVGMNLFGLLGVERCHLPIRVSAELARGFQLPTSRERHPPS
jgi:hypothetical protein